MSDLNWEQDQQRWKANLPGGAHLVITQSSRGGFDLSCLEKLFDYDRYSTLGHHITLEEATDYAYRWYAGKWLEAEKDR
jgi:hypothetical protein